MITLGLPTALAFAVAAWRYLVVARQRRAVLLRRDRRGVGAARPRRPSPSSFTESWRVSWWVWHVLMVVAFGAIAVASSRMPEHERFSDLYLDSVAGGTREVTVLFADLKGFTTFSEEHPPDEVRSMLNTYFESVLPDIRAAGGRLDRFIGDAVMVTFNVSVDQPDHAARAARAALEFQAAAAAWRSAIRAGHAFAPA